MIQLRYLHIFACLLVLFHQNMLCRERQQRNQFNNRRDEKNNTMLHAAARMGKIKALKHLLKEADNIDIKNDNGQTPLHLAIENNRVQATKILLANGADPSLENNEGKDALKLALEAGAKNFRKKRVNTIIRLVKKSFSGKKKTKRSIVKQDKPIPQKTKKVKSLKPLDESFAVLSANENGNTLIHGYALSGNLQELRELVKKYGPEKILINTKNKRGESPLHIAARKGNIKVINYLFDTFDDVILPDLRNNNGQTPLYLAIANNRVQAVKRLMQQGADPNFRDNKGQNAFDLLETSRSKKYPKKRIQSIKKLLKDTPQITHQQEEAIEIKEDADHLNLLIFLDKGGEEQTGVEEGKIKPVTTKLMRSIQQELTTIASRNLVSNIVRHEGKRTSRKAMISKVMKNLRNKDKWLIYVTGANLDPSDLSTGEFVIFVPRNRHNVSSLDDISLGGAKTIQVNSNQLDQLITPEGQLKTKFADVDQLIKIIQPNPSIRKRVYINGHGGYDKTIANMYFDDYQKLLVRLSDSGCDFLFIATCFGAGMSLLKAHKVLREDHTTKGISDNLEVTFPIVLGALTDTPTQGLKGSKYGKFFKSLDDYFSKRGKNSPVSAQPFKDILIHLTGPILNHTPSIRLPGLRGYFRPVDVDNNIELITYPRLLQHELAELRNITRDGGILLPSKVKEIKEKPYVIKKEAVLLYPSMITVPLASENPPKIISMIPGNARHFIKKLNLNKEVDVDGDMPNKEDLFDILKTMFLSWFQYKRASRKVVFIKELEFNNITLKNALIVSNGFVRNSVKKANKNNIKLECIASLDNQYFSLKLIYETKKKKVVSEKVTIEELDKKEAVETINKVITKSKPEEGALFEASGGIELDEKLERLVGRSTGLIKESFMQEQIRKAKASAAKKRAQKESTLDSEYPIAPPEAPLPAW